MTLCRAIVRIRILNRKFKKETLTLFRFLKKVQFFFFFFIYKITVVKETNEWLLCWLVLQTQRRIDEGINAGLDSFSARNKAQVYRAAVLSKVYGEVIRLLLKL